MDQEKDFNNEFAKEDIPQERIPEYIYESKVDRREDSWFLRTRNVIYYILGVVEVLLAFRLAFKMLGANPASSFVDFLYSFTGVLIAPFVGIFNTFGTRGARELFVFEPATVVAMIVYAIVARGVVNLVKLKASERSY